MRHIFATLTENFIAATLTALLRKVNASIVFSARPEKNNQPNSPKPNEFPPTYSLHICRKICNTQPRVVYSVNSYGPARTSSLYVLHVARYVYPPPAWEACLI
jgi:hypothetical protein